MPEERVQQASHDRRLFMCPPIRRTEPCPDADFETAPNATGWVSAAAAVASSAGSQTGPSAASPSVPATYGRAALAAQRGP